MGGPVYLFSDYITQLSLFTISVHYTGGCLSLKAMTSGSLCFIQVGECILFIHYIGESVCTLYRWVFESEGHDVGFTVFYIGG